MDRDDYTYQHSGFSRFFRRAIDNPANPVNSLKDLARGASQQHREINYDQQNVSGNMSGVMRVGTINIDGQKSHITISDDNTIRAVFGADINE